MEYKAATTKDRFGKLINEDSFVSITGDNPAISIQKAAHDFYHTFHPKNIPAGEIYGLFFYKKKPSDFSWPVLEYRAINSGRAPTDYAVEVKSVTANLKSREAALSGTRWIHHTLLSPMRYERAAKKEEAQKNNRRKWGDSPNTN